MVNALETTTLLAHLLLYGVPFLLFHSEWGVAPKHLSEATKLRHDDEIDLPSAARFAVAIFLSVVLSFGVTSKVGSLLRGRGITDSTRVERTVILTCLPPIALEAASIPGFTNAVAREAAAAAFVASLACNLLLLLYRCARARGASLPIAQEAICASRLLGVVFVATACTNFEAAEWDYMSRMHVFCALCAFLIMFLNLQLLRPSSWVPVSFAAASCVPASLLMLTSEDSFPGWGVRPHFALEFVAASLLIGSLLAC